MSRLGTQLAGVAFLVILSMILGLTVATYQKVFTPLSIVTLRTDRVGNQLSVNAEVKARGVPFGTVRSIHTGGGGAEVELALNPAKIEQLPSNVSARLIPKTLFGERYVNLIIPDPPSSLSLEDGDVIPQDRSENAIELERVLGNALPLLRAVQPEKLSASLGSISMALDGRGEPLGQSIVRLNKLLRKQNPLIPQIKTDISKLADVANVYNSAAPDILRALADLSVTGRTIADQRANLEQLYASGTTLSQDMTKFLRENKANLIALTASSRPTLELMARYAPEFPCLFNAVERFTPLMEKALGDGTNEPGMHVNVTVYPTRGAYEPGVDGPVYTAGGGPRCYPPGVGPSGGVTAMASEGLGIANSPYERQFVSELLAPRMGVRPTVVPEWNTLLVGPVLRGTEVTLK